MGHVVVPYKPWICLVIFDIVIVAGGMLTPVKNIPSHMTLSNLRSPNFHNLSIDPIKYWISK